MVIEKRLVSKKIFKYSIGVVLIFLLVSGPALYQRHDEFGSPFHYGENNKYFVDNYHQLWSKNVPVPSFSNYLETHNFSDYFEKFFMYGVLNVIYRISFNMLGPLLLFFLGVGLLFSLKNVKSRLLLLAVLVFLFFYVPVAHIFGSDRHLDPILPVLLLFTTIGFYKAISSSKFRSTLSVLFVLTFLLFSLHSISNYYLETSTSHVGYSDDWAAWIAKNVEGHILMIEGGPQVMRFVEDASIAGGGLVELYSPELNLSINRPGYFSSLAEAMPYFKDTGTTHVALDKIHIQRRPYLREVYTNHLFSGCFTRLYSNIETNTKWGMDVFEIDYASCNYK